MKAIHEDGSSSKSKAGSTPSLKDCLDTSGGFY
jgi:hypothetical protein